METRGQIYGRKGGDEFFELPVLPSLIYEANPERAVVLGGNAFLKKKIGKKLKNSTTDR